MAEQRESLAGVSFKDVDVMVRDLQNTYNCNIHFTTTTPAASGTSVLFWLKIEATPRWVGKKTVRGAIACQRRWPHVDHKTWAGLMLHLCYELSEALERAGQVPVQEALFD